MRFNDRELVKVAEGAAVIEGILQHLKPQRTDYWYQQPVFKERFFKLVNNLLFYFRVTEPEEPVGIIVMENVQVTYETHGPAFAFALVFIDGKHVFACRCQDDVNKWVTALKTSSYQYWRSMYAILRTKMNFKLGTDLVQNRLKCEEDERKGVMVTKLSRSTFYGQMECGPAPPKVADDVPVQNLIDL